LSDETLIVVASSRRKVTVSLLRDTATTAEHIRHIEFYQTPVSRRRSKYQRFRSFRFPGLPGVLSAQKADHPSMSSTLLPN
jgi:hypothetical protein